MSENSNQVGNYVLKKDSDLTTVTIPDGVKRIDDDAFKDRKDITSIIIPNTVTSIGNRAFYGCRALTSITIPDSVTEIGDEAFYGCRTLANIKLPDSVTSIGYCAFTWCDSVTDITIPNSVTSIDTSAFAYCMRLKSITIPASVTEIGDEVFYDCRALTSISVEEGNENYHSDGNCLIETASGTLIAGCNNSVIPQDGSVSSIGYCAFYGRKELTSITIPDSVEVIDIGAFERCSALTSITIPYGVEEIGENAFEGCKALTGITIPNSVESIGECAFADCEGLTNITVEEGNAKYHSSGNCLIETETKTLVLGCKNSVIPQDGSVTRIGACAFYGCSGLTSITIPNSLMCIDKDVFRGCDKLQTIYYNGTEEQWKEIDIESKNSRLEETEIVFLNDDVDNEVAK